MKGKRQVAIFDVDGTIFRSSLLIELTNVLIERNIFPEEARKYFEREYTEWLDREGTYESYIGAVIKSFMKHIKGVHYGELMDAAEHVLDEHQNRVYRYTRDLVGELKKKGYFLLAISQSPKAILDKFCEQYGFDKVYGRIYETGPGDRFTGIITDEHLIANKANIVKRAIEKEGLTLEGSVGVGDTEGDIPVLEMVETAICFNPNNTLYKYAKINGWKVVVERKDVVYEL
jgi:HAD superfamily hydrolase (TIGR01490 family)